MYAASPTPIPALWIVFQIRAIYWTFLDGEDRYSFTTKELNHSLVSEGPPKKIAITCDILFFMDGKLYKGLPGDIVSQEKNIVSMHTLLWSGKAV